MSIPNTPFRFFFSLICQKFTARVGMLAGLSALSVALMSLEPILLRDLIRALEVDTKSPQKAYEILGLIVLVWLLSLTCNRGRDLLELKTHPEFRFATQQMLYAWLDQHSAEFFRSNHSGNLAQKIKQTGQAVLGLLDITFDHTVRLIATMVMAVFVLSSVPPYFLTTFFAWVLLFIPLAWWFARRVLPLSQAFAEAASSSSGVLADITANIDTVRACGQLTAERINFSSTLEVEKQASIKTRGFLIKMTTSLHGAQLVFQSSFVGLAVFSHLQGRIDTSELIMIISMSAILLTSVLGLTQQLQGFYDQSGTVKAALDTLCKPHEIREAFNAPALVVKEGAVRIDGVSLRFGERSLFDRLDLVIAPGEKVGLVGPSGGGKSTLLKLIKRQLDPQSGHVFIDDQDLKGVSLESISAAITEVPQEPLLFHRSLLENVRYGHPAATEAELMLSLRRARCEGFIALRAEGLLAVVGERGLRLSGGERQRIALARAFLKNAPIVLLDEATSAVDSITEEQIQGAVLELCTNRTVIAIAHRLSTLKFMDRIVVLEGGRLIDSGKHEDLIQRCSLYRNLWGHQV